MRQYAQFLYESYWPLRQFEAQAAVWAYLGQYL
jgi:hypothetical protein